LQSYLNPANAITASRLVTLPPFYYFVDHGVHEWAVLMVFICGLLDKVDGTVARAFDCASDFGAFFDAIADGVSYAFILTVLVAFGWVPWPPVVAILVLGGLNSVFRVVYVRRAGRAVNFHSVASERLVGFTAYLGGFGAAGYEVEFYYYACAALMFVVIGHDAKRMLIDPVEA